MIVYFIIENPLKHYLQKLHILYNYFKRKGCDLYDCVKCYRSSISKDTSMLLVDLSSIIHNVPFLPYHVYIS